LKDKGFFSIQALWSFLCLYYYREKYQEVESKLSKEKGGYVMSDAVKEPRDLNF